MAIKKYKRSSKALSEQRREPSEELATFLLVSHNLGIWKRMNHSITLAGLPISRMHEGLWSSAQ